MEELAARAHGGQRIESKKGPAGKYPVGTFGAAEK